MRQFVRAAMLYAYLQRMCSKRSKIDAGVATLLIAPLAMLLSQRRRTDRCAHRVHHLVPYTDDGQI